MKLCWLQGCMSSALVASGSDTCIPRWRHPACDGHWSPSSAFSRRQFRRCTTVLVTKVSVLHARVCGTARHRTYGKTWTPRISGINWKHCCLGVNHVALWRFATPHHRNTLICLLIIIIIIAAVVFSGLATGIYTTNSPDACWYVADSAKCNVIIVDSDKQLQKILKVRHRLPDLRAIVQYNEPLRQHYDHVYTVETVLALASRWVMKWLYNSLVCVQELQSCKRQMHMTLT